MFAFALRSVTPTSVKLLYQPRPRACRSFIQYPNLPNTAGVRFEALVLEVRMYEFKTLLRIQELLQGAVKRPVLYVGTAGFSESGPHVAENDA